jgi:hypothetical protein
VFVFSGLPVPEMPTHFGDRTCGLPSGGPHGRVFPSEISAPRCSGMTRRGT